MTNKSENINELATALSKAQSEIRNAEQDKNNPHFKSKYATLTSLWDACREPLTKNGLSVVQTFDDADNKLRLVTTLMHSSGQWIRSSFPINQSLKIQETGSVTTYARRYSLSSIVGIAPGDNDDDDGEKSMQRSVKPDLQDLVKPECTREQVDALLELVKQFPEERQKNFYKILASKNWSDPYQISLKFCQFQTDAARVMIASKTKEEEALPF